MELVAQMYFRLETGAAGPLVERETAQIAQKAAASTGGAATAVTCSSATSACMDLEVEVEQFMSSFLDDETSGSSLAYFPGSGSGSGCDSGALDLDAVCEDADLIDELGGVLFDDNDIDEAVKPAAGRAVSPSSSVVALAPSVPIGTGSFCTSSPGVTALSFAVGGGGAVVVAEEVVGVVTDKKRKSDEIDAHGAFQPAYSYGAVAYGAGAYEGAAAVAKMEKEVRRQETSKYRRTVAIPRYLRKKANRNWSKKAMYESRTKAAKARSRVNGKFVVSDDSEPGFYFV